MLEIKNISKTYHPKKGVPVRALDGVSLSIAEKGLVFILGKSGSGKSTLLNLLGGLDRADSGEIIIYGKSSAHFSQSDFDSYRNTFIGFIFQEYNILNEFTVGANIALAMELQGKKATPEALGEILDEVDLSGYAARHPNELSGGQKQRVAIARALIKRPEIILADEPTGALDSKTGIAVFDTLKKLSATKLVIVVSHDREFAEQYGDRVIELSDGKIISDIQKQKSEIDSSKGVSAVSDSLIRVKQGYTLTQADLDMINSYLSRPGRGDVFISVDDKMNGQIKRIAGVSSDNVIESFVPSTPENVKIKKYNPADFSMIRSRLPLRNSLRMALSSLKIKPFRLFMTILLSSLAFSLFGLAFTMSTYNNVDATLSSFNDSSINSTGIAMSRKIDLDNGNSYYSGTNMEQEDIDRLQEKFPGLIFLPVFSTETDIADNLLDISRSRTPGSYMPYYNHTVYGYTSIDAEVLDRLGFTLTGRLPEGDNEIAVTEYIREHFTVCGYTTDSGETKKETVPDAEGLIGLTLEMSEPSGETYTATIVGVIDTGLDSSRYKDFMPKTSEEASPEYDFNVASFMLYQELTQLLEYGYHSICYVSDERLKELPSLDIGINCSQANGYLGFSSDDPVLSDNFYAEKIARLSELPPDSYSLFEGFDTFPEDGLLMPTQRLFEYLSYNGMDLSPYFNRLSTADKAERRSIIMESAASLSGLKLNIMYQKYNSENDGEPKPLRICGVYFADILNDGSAAPWSTDDFEFWNFATAVIHDSLWDTLEVDIPAPYSFVVTPLPESYGERRDLVEYCQGDGDGDGIGYMMKNSVSYMIDEIGDFVAIASGAFTIVGAVLAVFSSLLLMNFITISINNKKREIGILRAVGARGADVLSIFFNEAAIIALINWTVSVVITAITVSAINGRLRKDYQLLVSFLTFGVGHMLLMLIICLAAALIASALPVLRISRKKPIDAILNK